MKIIEKVWTAVFVLLWCIGYWLYAMIPTFELLALVGLASAFAFLAIDCIFGTNLMLLGVIASLVSCIVITIIMNHKRWN